MISRSKLPTAGYIYRPCSFLKGLVASLSCLKDSKDGPETRRRESERSQYFWTAAVGICSRCKDQEQGKCQRTCKTRKVQGQEQQHGLDKPHAHTTAWNSRASPPGRSLGELMSRPMADAIVPSGWTCPAFPLLYKLNMGGMKEVAKWPEWWKLRACSGREDMEKFITT